jgi:uncharacterized phage-associated protein/DNA-binding XRE family transcriptional regulator
MTHVQSEVASIAAVEGVDTQLDNDAIEAAGRAFAEQIDFSHRLRELRSALNLTQRQAGEIVGEQQSEISRMERGDVNPSIARANQVLGSLAEYGARQAQSQPQQEGTPSALDVAKYFLAARDPDDEITALKLQKLLYYSQGYGLALLRHPVFTEPVLAWKNGPVVREVYNAYSGYGRNPIPSDPAFSKRSLDIETRELLDHVYEKYGVYSAYKLRDMTHAEDPWAKTPPDEEITVRALASYFSHELGQDGDDDVDGSVD